MLTSPGVARSYNHASQVPRMVERRDIHGAARVPSESEWHTLSVAAAAERLQTDTAHGLSASAASDRLAQFGPNALAHTPERSGWSMLIAQFRSLVVVLLVAATAIALVVGDFMEAVAIVVVIVLNAGIGFATEWKARRALSALQKQSARVAHVIRNGAAHEVPAAELVPGDLIVLAAGERVPADGRLVESARLQIEEAALTGESLAVTKSIDRLADNDTPLGDRRNMVFLGTTITEGRGRAVVTATGAQSEVGKIGVLIDEASTRLTPLELKLARLGRLLVIIMIVLCAIIVVAGWLRGVADFWAMAEIGLSLAIAAVPEGLPAVTTMTLALGMQRMARMRALVRRLPAVETLGSVTVICTDKTGTLTKNEMTVCHFVLDHHKIDVTGTGYASVGSFEHNGISVDPRNDAHLQLALRIGMLCNDAKIDRSDGCETVLGDPTEAALLVAAEKAGMTQAALHASHPRIGELPFDPNTKRMVTVHRTPEGRRVAFVKGSPGSLLAASEAQIRNARVDIFLPDDRERWERANNELAGAALRVLGLAYRELPDEHTDDDISRNLVFVGLVAMSDPLREEAKTAVATCRDAGIRTIMITGDQPPTAAEIARQLGIDTAPDGVSLRTVHDRELSSLDPAGWDRVIADTAVFARVSPQHKLEIVKTLQQQGHIVAMTGDGVNDAPALKKADIGIAMGIKGTEVAKENAAMVITDDNFSSIVNAVEQGRIIYGNILRFLHYLLSCNFSEILTIFIALMSGWPLPLTALQILWLNLVTDVFPAFALALEPSAPGAMKRPPRHPKEPLLSVNLAVRIGLEGLLLAGVTLVAFGVGMRWHGMDDEHLYRPTTMAFTTLALAQVFHVFSARSQSRSAFTRRLFVNPWVWLAVAGCVALQLAAIYVPLLRRVLQTMSPSLSEWGVIVACSLAPLAIVEVSKLIRRYVARPKQVAHRKEFNP